MTTNGHREKPSGKSKKRPWWVLIVLVIMVLLLSVLALNSPISQRAEDVTPSLTGLDEIVQDTGMPAPTMAYPIDTTLEPATPEEIGSTDGIILWSAILILILLVGTLRELLYQETE